ncbi:FtsX-like permease family protein [uncultured archaeon]|nr:FtsX-like permease family protein [uncultured archaeon]
MVVSANNLKALSGRMLKSSDSKKVMVGYDLWAKNVFSKPVAVDGKLLINGVAFQVVGLLDKAGMNNEAVIMNENDARDLLSEPDKYSMIVAQVSAGSVPSEVGARVARALRRDRGQKEGFEDFTVQTSEELIKSVNTILGVVQAIFVGIAAISLLVGGIGIMNTMYTSVLERTHDIGIMKAIGARNGDIMMIFLLESGLLGLSGGIVGVLLGVGLSKLVEYFGSQSVGLLQATFPWYLIVGALSFSLFVGMFSGVFPARQAAKLPPVEALRE